jgi:uncharacterized membrane protein
MFKVILIGLLQLGFLYFFIGIILVKLIQLFDTKKGVEKKEEFYLCVCLWPIIFCMFLGDNMQPLSKSLFKKLINCSVCDWLFHLGRKK